MYEGEEKEKLQYRTLRGVPSSIAQYKSGKTTFRTQKEAMTPEKRMAVNMLLKNRVQNQQVSPAENVSRIAQPYVNILINSAFSNLRRFEEKTEDQMIVFAEKRPRIE